jgi:hypothetical protein
MYTYIHTVYIYISTVDKGIEFTVLQMTK